MWVLSDCGLETYNIFEYNIEHERTFLKLKIVQKNISEIYSIGTFTLTKMRLKLIKLVD